mmetsp:Transcript_14106/g.23465  ORF Transcript_14106/g.23465 Transcript_14106/m.23465 type:complete len:613 (-) Transcript_14106:247-2085(-)|eukprot:CAMPEP_0175003096 /NCGR_PEP_ID=MMETSP0005-20121125/4041_1 /TAXON_ID=420556 /ORGANISM="Ochromonas sp., Strain CCMP1393" /LENGTH=612 /DNA_ID=CAMNT_0016258139 /DNA_START=43 /DNA_END=1881 /DNA_ORIENTATION=-
MSLYSSSIDKSFLPNLPGFRSKPTPSGYRKHIFQIVNGQVIEQDRAITSGSEVMDDASVTSIGNTIATLHKRKPTMEMQGLTLTFQAYFEERPIDRPAQVRKCNIYFFIDDGSLKIVEKPQVNSGVSQGTLVKRAVIPKADGTPVTEYDLRIGENLTVYGRTFKLLDCDGATRNYLKKNGIIEDDSTLDMPRDTYMEYRQSLEPGHDNGEWGKFHSRKNDNKTFIEAKLGHYVDNKGREGFIRFGNKQLKFKCLWDNTNQLYGDVMEYTLGYFLCDDSVEINSVPDPNKKEQRPAKLLKRARLPKNFASTMALGERPTDSKFFHWTDIHIGMYLEVYGRRIQVIDADRNTRDFYESFEFPLSQPIVIPKPVVIVHEREIPPPTGFGSEEDSLRSVSGSLLPGPLPMKKLGENKILSFFSSLLSGGPDDVDRRFVISFYLQDNTVKIVEPPIRNSGFVGGVFLSRREIKLPGGGVLTEKDLYVGNKVQILMHRFLLLDANEGTLRWMEDNGKLPRSNIYMILDKLRPALMEPAQTGELRERFKALEVPEYGESRATKEAAAEVFAQYGLMNDTREGLCEHDLRTILRVNLNRLPHFDYETLIANIVRPSDEFK